MSTTANSAKHDPVYLQYIFRAMLSYETTCQILYPLKQAAVCQGKKDLQCARIDEVRLWLAEGTPSSANSPRASSPPSLPFTPYLRSSQQNHFMKLARPPSNSYHYLYTLSISFTHDTPDLVFVTAQIVHLLQYNARSLGIQSESSIQHPTPPPPFSS